MRPRSMIRIHRRQPVVRLGERTVKLTEAEHALMIALGMLDNRLTPHEILLEFVRDGRAPVPTDKNILSMRMVRLRRKIGSHRLECRKNLGYILVGDVQFYG